MCPVPTGLSFSLLQINPCHDASDQWRPYIYPLAPQFHSYVSTQDKLIAVSTKRLVCKCAWKHCSEKSTGNNLNVHHLAKNKQNGASPHSGILLSKKKKEQTIFLIQFIGYQVYFFLRHKY